MHLSPLTPDLRCVASRPRDTVLPTGLCEVLWWPWEPSVLVFLD